MSKLAKKTKTSRKMQKNSNQLKAKRIINIKISARGDPVFTFSLPGGADRPFASRQFRHRSWHMGMLKVAAGFWQSRLMRL